MPGGRYRFEFMLNSGEDVEEMLRSDVAEERLLAPLIPRGSATIERTASYTFFGAVAKQWRQNRVFLAGDAAHLMPPFLGQGMCSGIRDAHNLAWKLDRVIGGGAPEVLLDTYELERRPHVAQVIQAAVDFGRIICVTDDRAAAERNSRFLADPRPLVERFKFRLPELLPGPLVLEGGGGLFPQPMVNGSTRLDDWVGRRFLILAEDQSTLGRSDEFWWSDEDVLMCTIDDLPDPTGAARATFERFGTGVVLVRPDRYVLGTAADLDLLTGRLRPLLDRRVSR
jgi:3-(3-hydroxy-phenyl)propionate hydroxylase